MSSTPWTRRCDCVTGRDSVGSTSQATTPSATMTTIAAHTRRALPDNGDSERRKHRELPQRKPLRRAGRVVEKIGEDVLRVVHVHDAEERRDARAADVSVARDADVETRRRRESLRVSRTD